MPVGWMYPNFQASKMHKKSKTEKPTLKAKALAMRLVLAWPLRPSRIMKNNAEPKLTKMAMKARATKNFMGMIFAA
jgi:hypothetical protein